MISCLPLIQLWLLGHSGIPKSKKLSYSLPAIGNVGFLAAGCLQAGEKDSACRGTKASTTMSVTDACEVQRLTLDWGLSSVSRDGALLMQTCPGEVRKEWAKA